MENMEKAMKEEREAWGADPSIFDKPGDTEEKSKELEALPPNAIPRHLDTLPIPVEPSSSFSLLVVDLVSKAFRNAMVVPQSPAGTPASASDQLEKVRGRRRHGPLGLFGHLVSKRLASEDATTESKRIKVSTSITLKKAASHIQVNEGEGPNSDKAGVPREHTTQHGSSSVIFDDSDDETAMAETWSLRSGQDKTKADEKQASLTKLLEERKPESLQRSGCSIVVPYDAGAQDEGTKAWKQEANTSRTTLELEGKSITLKGGSRVVMKVMEAKMKSMREEIDELTTLATAREEEIRQMKKQLKRMDNKIGEIWDTFAEGSGSE